MTNLRVTIENGKTFFENGIYRRLSISLKIYMIITKPISFRSDMGGGWGDGICHLGRICSFVSDPELQLVHLFQLVLSSQCKLANQWGKRAYISMLLDPGSSFTVSSLFFIINFCCIFFLCSVFSCSI